MSQIHKVDDAHGRLFSVDADRNALAGAVATPRYLDRLREITSEAETCTSEALGALLRLGADWLSVEQGHLARIDVAEGTHTIAEVDGPHPVVSEGDTQDLSTTFCRTVLAQNATLALHDAPAEGWADDPAYEASGLRTYLGTKVVVEGSLYGTLCFVDRAARPEAFGEEEAAAVGLLARATEEILADIPPERRRAHPTPSQLEALFEQSPNMINIHDEEGTLLAPNPHLCKKTGYTREELVGMKVWDLDRDASPDVAPDFWADLEPGERARWEGTYERKDGSSFPVEVDLRRLNGEDAPRFLVTSRDITEQKETEEQLRREHDLLNRVFTTSPAAIVMLNRDGEFVEASDRAEEVLGLEQSEVTDRTYNDPEWNIRGPEGGAISDEDLPFARVTATGEPVYDVEHRIAWPDGTHRLLSVSGAPLRSADGTLDGVVFHLDDITEQRAAEQALREERDRFATLFHNLPTPVVQGQLDDEGQVRIQAVNERFEAVFGYEEDDIRGDDLQPLIVPEEETSATALMRERLLAGETVNQVVQRQTAEGLRDFRIQVALRQGDDDPTEGFAIYTDVTERKKRERALARQKALLTAQAEASLDGLLAVDTDRRVAFFNERFLQIWNVPTNPSADVRLDAPFEQGALDAMEALLPDPEAFREEVEYLHDHPDQESRDVMKLTDGRWIDRYSAPIVGDEGNRFGRLWVFRDVTEQRQMMERLLEVQEEERRRIDQEIHDEMGGLLTSLQFTIDLGRRTAQNEGVTTEHFDQIDDLVSELSLVSRTISRKLYPSALSEHGLAEAIANLIDELENEHDLDVDLYSEVGPGDRFSVPVERTVYWIMQEILMGIARSDDVDAAQIILNPRGDQLYLHLFDEEEDLSSSTGNRRMSARLEAIRRRVEWLDGEVRIDPILDEGTRVSVILPVRPPLLAP